MKYLQDASGALGGRAAACPVTGFDHKAIRWSVPDILKAATAGIAADGEGELAARIWATMLAAAALRSMNEHFLLQARSSFSETPSVYLFDNTSRAIRSLRLCTDKSFRGRHGRRPGARNGQTASTKQSWTEPWVSSR